MVLKKVKGGLHELKGKHWSVRVCTGEVVALTGNGIQAQEDSISHYCHFCLKTMRVPCKGLRSVEFLQFVATTPCAI